MVLDKVTLLGNACELGRFASDWGEVEEHLE
jgi:hypothetical protein